MELSALEDNDGLGQGLPSVVSFKLKSYTTINDTNVKMIYNLLPAAGSATVWLMDKHFGE